MSGKVWGQYDVTFEKLSEPGRLLVACPLLVAMQPTQAADLLRVQEGHRLTVDDEGLAPHVNHCAVAAQEVDAQDQLVRPGRQHRVKIGDDKRGREKHTNPA
eukprot:gnl/Ergobibamus_cyprinoides/5469.p2 GENE.gnl/Ergobibamus_cyprinoides/5469~~gnl/Ergobibamus_cyprinoides/5469.p2  ORF type:complete len:102 (-),score=2.64 gnl/Ergobibamus_cyprinoides/5469:196-501(-)